MWLTYFGQTAFMLEETGTTVLFGSWLTDTTHTEASVDTFDDTDAISVSYRAFDHLGDVLELGPTERGACDL